MKIFLKKSVVFLLLIALLVNIGCYTYSRGDFTGYTEVLNSQLLKHYTYDYKISSQPTSNNPHLVLNFRKTPVYQYSAIENYNEIKTPKKGANTVPNILLYGGGLTAIGGLVLIADSNASKEKNETGYILIGSGLFGVLLGALTKVDSDPKVTNSKIKGKTVIKERNGEATSLINNTIRVIIDKNIKTYNTNSKGEINVDLVKDYGLASFNEEKNIDVEFEILSGETNILNIRPHSIKLKSSSWMTKYFSILADEIQVYDIPGSSGKKLGVCRKLERYQVLDVNSSGWTKVNFNGNSGWISTYAGNYIWLSE